MKRYNPTEIEIKWQDIWEQNGTYRVDFSDYSKPKYYAMSMLPGITGAGIHTGHGRTFQFSDIKVRAKRQQGYNAYHPIGWDSFGLPVENYAIKIGKKPREAHDEALVNFKRQLKRLGYSYDWSKEISTADPEYYRWTQWIFNQLFIHGLAYQKQSPQWWCDTDQTVLANEQVIGGKCWRCGNQVTKKDLNQWFFKITEYADEILAATDDLNWTEMVKTMQKNWIGRSVGAEVEFKIDCGGYFSYITGAVEEEIHQESSIQVLEKTSDGDFKVFIAKQDIHKYEAWIRKNLKPGFWNEYIGSETVFIFRPEAGPTETLQLNLENEQKILSLCNRLSDSDFDSVREMLSDNSFYAEKLQKITVFTTRPDTIFGATFMVLAPEHELVKGLVTDETRESVENYVAESARKSEIERMNESREKTGVFSGSYAINPVNGDKIPIWVADYVLASYGTGAIMAVPAHDERDGAFATKFNLPIKIVINPVAIRKDAIGKTIDVKNDKIVAAVTNDKGEILTINWGSKLGGRLLVGGTIEGNESPETTALREVTEETGYNDLKVVSTGDEIFYYVYYAFSKQQVHEAKVKFVHIKLNSDARVDQQLDESEKDNFKVEWIDQLTAENEITEPLHRYTLDKFILGKCYRGEGLLTNSGGFDDMESSDAREEIVAWLEQQHLGCAKTVYKMRDWLISRQRYWGAPIPIIHCPIHGAVPVPNDQLPVVLPDIEDYKPTGGATSALAGADEWVNTLCPTCGGPAKRETDTMDGYACSSWYFLRYLDPFNDKQAWNPEVEKHWGPVDFYNGADHAVAHLLYSRFWMRFFYKLGLVSDPEPFRRMMYNAYILAPDGTKMSKSKGNTIDPLEIMDSGYGADSLRVYEMFIAPYDLEAPWDTRGVPGAYRFLNRVWVLTQEYIDTSEVNLTDDVKNEILTIAHLAAKKVTTDIEDDKFNTAISSMMEAVNLYYKLKDKYGIGKSDAWTFAIESLLQILSPFAPHITEELWNQIGHNDTIHVDHWPKWDNQYLQSDTMTIVVQVNGKLRAKIDVQKDTTEDEIKRLALEQDNVAKYISGKQPIKVIYVPGRLVNVVVAD